MTDFSHTGAYFGRAGFKPGDYEIVQRGNRFQVVVENKKDIGPTWPTYASAEQFAQQSARTAKRASRMKAGRIADQSRQHSTKSR